MRGALHTAHTKDKDFTFIVRFCQTTQWCQLSCWMKLGNKWRVHMQMIGAHAHERDFFHKSRLPAATFIKSQASQLIKHIDPCFWLLSLAWSLKSHFDISLLTLLVSEASILLVASPQEFTKASFCDYGGSQKATFSGMSLLVPGLDSEQQMSPNRRRNWLRT